LLLEVSDVGLAGGQLVSQDACLAQAVCETASKRLYFSGRASRLLAPHIGLLTTCLRLATPSVDFFEQLLLSMPRAAAVQLLPELLYKSVRGKQLLRHVVASVRYTPVVGGTF
jgi:hypothetical protein